MSIQTADLTSEMEGLLDDERKDFWEPSDYRKHINQALRTCYGWVARANEFLFLELGTITIDSNAVTNGTLIFTLPERAMYVSHFCNQKSSSSTKGFDFRPLWKPASGDNSTLILFTDYMIGLPNIVFNTAFTTTGDVDLWHKKFPARVTENDATIAVPEVMFDFLLEMAMFYAKRKDENPEEETNLVFHRDQVLDMLKTQDGYPEELKVDWDNLADSGDY